MNYSRSFKKPLLPLLRSTSEQKFTPSNFYQRKKFIASRDSSSEEEREEVEKLTDWEKKDSKNEILNSISEATTRLNKRMTGQDIVEDIIVQRKLKKKLPNIKSSKIISLTQTTKLRQAKKETDESFRERCRYFRQFEDELSNNYKSLLELLKEYKRNRNDLRQECCDIKKRSSEAIQLYEKEKQNFFSLEFKGKKNDQEELIQWYAFRDRKSEELKEREKDKFRILQKVDEDVATRKLKLAELDELCKTLKKKVELVRRAQISHYLNLLKEGKDTKSEGLQWLVIALWKLNETVSLENFPSFLDQDAVHCILFISQKTLEAEEIIENILNPARRSTNFEPSVEKNKTIKQRLAKLTKRIKAEKPEYIYDKKAKQMNIKWVPCDLPDEEESSAQGGEDEMGYENYIEKIKDLVEATKENEINRLAIECNLHSYEERFKVSMKELVNAIVGSEACDKYLAVIMKEKKKFEGKIELTRTFKFSARRFS